MRRHDTTEGLPAQPDHPWTDIMNAGHKVVFSRTLKTADWANTTSHSKASELLTRFAFEDLQVRGSPSGRTRLHPTYAHSMGFNMDGVD